MPGFKRVFVLIATVVAPVLAAFPQPPEDLDSFEPTPIEITDSVFDPERPAGPDNDPGTEVDPSTVFDPATWEPIPPEKAGAGSELRRVAGRGRALRPDRHLHALRLRVLRPAALPGPRCRGLHRLEPRELLTAQSLWSVQELLQLPLADDAPRRRFGRQRVPPLPVELATPLLL